MRRKAEEQARHYCRECIHARPVHDFHTLTVHDRQPTLAECPYITDRKVLLSEKACQGHFKRV